MLIMLENMQILLIMYVPDHSNPPIFCLTPRVRFCMMESAKGRMTAENRKRRMNVMKYECPCGYIYDPEVGDPDSGIAPGTAFEDIPEDWVCPVCGLGKDAFTPA